MCRGPAFRPVRPRSEDKPLQGITKKLPLTGNGQQVSAAPDMISRSFPLVFHPPTRFGAGNPTAEKRLPDD
jgi:hypothetical protein